VKVYFYSFFNLDTRWGCVVKATLLPLYPRKRPGTHFLGGWVGPRAGLDGSRKSRPTGIRSPDRPARCKSLYQLRYPLYCKSLFPISPHNKGTHWQRYETVFQTDLMTRICHSRVRRVFGYVFLEQSA